MSDRGMKKYAPYSSLVEQATSLEKMRYQKNKIEKPKISSDLANKINFILKNCKGEILDIKFFYNGYIYTIKSALIDVNLNTHIAKFSDGNIPLKDIIDLNCENLSNKIDDFIS